ncbi:hypothetical protein TVAG_063290 [Trichomonas vaginalis G3]|uniref:receptor protein-tyrosine kinase n=1 Tax=Trichomonas vaginalis (strain ATCC PRA-98 / G3) TaxID=412133 RepID=A2GIT3_TRIV3|nr:glycine-rich protein family [Trichomonas vaginalis G3]EAX82934.1 hypothetical protein TVAG_063290 [Trichomonas vaginalis G3]KAI5538198.1 glycine-rich protein family [Trichomonas vaginalis G3]|eukprot:XP_001295864.1 hypothetical protein [Trichomonas vaginalis G3]
MGFYNSVPPNATITSGYGAGGSTDIRLVDGLFYDFESLKSRIIVSASGGSWEYYYSTPAYAGGLFSINTSTYYCHTEASGSIAFTFNGANQTSPGSQGYNGPYYKDMCFPGTFGIAGYIANKSQNWGGTGGNGYYAGCSTWRGGGSTGGSSFISGHPGCDAISNESSSFENIIHTGQPIHYSNLSFFNTLMIGGQGKIPLPWIHKQIRSNIDRNEDLDNDKYYETGHQGHGFIRITLFDEAIFLTCKAQYPFSQGHIISLLIFILIYSK